MYDKCQASGAWKCCACLNLCNKVYSALIAASCSSVLYLCEEYESSTMKKHDSSMEYFRKMLEKMLEKIKGIEQTIGTKATMQLSSCRAVREEIAKLRRKITGISS